MNELLAIALDAHGGLDRWNKLKGLSAGMSISGSTWGIKGQPDLFNNVRIEMPDVGTKEEVVTVSSSSAKVEFTIP